VSITNLQGPTSKLSCSNRRPTRCWTIWSTEKSQMRLPTRTSRTLLTITITSYAKKAPITQPFPVHSVCRTTKHLSSKTSVRLIRRAYWSNLLQQMASIIMDSTCRNMETRLRWWASRWSKEGTTIRQLCSNIATTHLSVIWSMSVWIPESADCKVPRRGTWRISSFQPQTMK